MGPTGSPPPARSGHTAIYDPVRDRMVVFGGGDYNFERNDVWALSLGVSPAWSQITPSGSLPPARSEHTAIYDPMRDRMVVYGGRAGSTTSRDVWVLTLAGNPAWSEIAATGAPPYGHYQHSAIYDSVRDRMVIYGGDVWA